jgi:hypothetical protein
MNKNVFANRLTDKVRFIPFQIQIYSVNTSALTDEVI